MAEYGGVLYKASMWKAVGKRTAGSFEASLSYTTAVKSKVCRPTDR